MRPPTVIDDTFWWDRERFAWVQDSTGMVVTQDYVETMNIPITNTWYQNSRFEIGPWGVAMVLLAKRAVYHALINSLNTKDNSEEGSPPCPLP